MNEKLRIHNNRKTDNDARATQRTPWTLTGVAARPGRVRMPPARGSRRSLLLQPHGLHDGLEEVPAPRVCYHLRAVLGHEQDGAVGRHVSGHVRFVLQRQVFGSVHVGPGARVGLLLLREAVRVQVESVGVSVRGRGRRGPFGDVPQLLPVGQEQAFGVCRFFF